MTRPNVTAWARMGNRWACTVRQPYHDIEVWPDGDGYRWVVSRIDPHTGMFRAVENGTATSLSIAKSAAFNAVRTD